MNPNPDVATAIPDLERRGLLPAPHSATALRLARGELLSVRPELRLALSSAVLLIAAGVSVLVRENYERLGPGVIAGAIGLAAAGCLAWVWRTAPRFTWGAATSSSLALDSVLLLGALLAATDLAFVEAEFTPLGEHWPWHLLVVAVGYSALGLRFDSRTLWSLALTTFAAWRGVAVGWREAESWLGDRAAAVRWNAIACGVAFLVVGALMRRFGRKRHFEPLTVALGWLLVLGAQASAITEAESWAPWAGALFLTGAGLAAGAMWRRRFGLFALGVLGGYVGVTTLVLRSLDVPELGCAWLFATSILLVAGVVVAQRLWFRTRTEETT